MTKSVIDAYAWIEYFEGSSAGEIVKEKIINPSNEIYTSTVTIAEVISKIKRVNRDFEIAYKAIITLSKPISVDDEAAKEVGLLYAEIKKKILDFGLADAFVLNLARSIKAKVLTGDSHFKNFPETVMI